MDNDLRREIDKRLLGIANMLVLNSHSIYSLGLVNGQMGVAIFFYQYARYSNNEYYEEYAGRLIDNIIEKSGNIKSFDFSNGLMGIGWGFEYLVQNKFIEANTDEVLEDTDIAIRNRAMQYPGLDCNADFYGYGLYFSSRIDKQEKHTDASITPSKKQILLYLHDDCERILTSKSLCKCAIPSLTVKQLNSVLYFLLAMQKLKIYPSKLQELLSLIPNYITDQLLRQFDLTDRFVFLELITSLCIGIHDSNLQKQYKNAMAMYFRSSFSSFSRKENGIRMLINTGWYSILYDICFSTYEDLDSFFKESYSLLDNGSFYMKRKENELTGLGIALLNLVNNRLF